MDVATRREGGELFFFFQAEDGIRDIGVTGVQTCALPISRTTMLDCSSNRGGKRESRTRRFFVCCVRNHSSRGSRMSDTSLWMTSNVWERSEERRVGKECRSRWSPYH